MFDSTFKHELGNGYYFTSKDEPNGLGGYHPVKLTLYHETKGRIKRITNFRGSFVDFPGVIQGDWVKDMSYPFEPRMRFRYSVNDFKDGLLEFFWTLQPDGRYYGDDDGFGMEHDVEIVLVSRMNEAGDFVEPFHIRER